MNYYIQGNKEKADKIKTAFEKLGYNTGYLEFTSGQLYYTVEGKVELMCTKSLQNLIKTHPDYKELELPVEPLFKVGDSLQSGSYWAKIRRIDAENRRYICDFDNVIPFEEQELWSLVPNSKPHYDIANFKPFDKVLVRCSNDEEWMIEFYCKYDTLVHTSPHRDYPFMGIGDSYSQCIPFEGNEHLLGTIDPCDERFINW